MDKISDQWCTPKWLFDELNSEFEFYIDLCATQNNTKFPERFCNDYLNTDFRHSAGTAFMNPPYSDPKPFIMKAWDDSRFIKIVCLVKCDPSTKWWSTFWEYGPYNGPKIGCKVRFFPKRIKFDPPEEWKCKGKGGCSFPSALIIMDRRTVC